MGILQVCRNTGLFLFHGSKFRPLRAEAEKNAVQFFFGLDVLFPFAFFDFIKKEKKIIRN